MRANLWLAGAALICAVALPVQADANQYHWVDMGALNPSDPDTKPRSMNGRGQVVGYSVVHGYHHAFVFENGAMAALEEPPGATGSEATGINDAGTIAGFYYLDGTAHAVIWQTASHSILELGHMDGDTASNAYAINAQGKVVGISSGPNGNRIVVWQDGSMTQILGDISPFAINGQEEIVGAVVRNGATLAAMARANQISLLGRFVPTGQSQAYSINDSEEIVGVADVAGGKTHAFLWRQTTGMVDLGTLGGGFSSALGLNRQRQIVGFSSVRLGSGQEQPHACLWDNGKKVDLNAVVDTPPPSVLLYAYAIGDDGKIVVVTQNHHGLLLTPLVTTNGPVDITSQVSIGRGKVPPRGKVVAQTVTLRNVAGTTLTGPFWVVVQDLPSGVQLLNPTGMTKDGLPYLAVKAKSLANRQSTVVGLRFRRPTAKTVVTCTLRVMAGQAP